MQFSTNDGIPSLNGLRVKFDANGDVMDQDFTVYNYNNRISAPNFAFEEVSNQVVYKCFAIFKA